MKHSCLIVALLSLVSCGSDDIECSIGRLDGTWRFDYYETDGTCGPIPSETVSFRPGAPTECVEYVSRISADSCRIDLDYECPTDDDRGAFRWVVVYSQVEEGLLLGDGTVTLDHLDLGSCRSTYDIEVRRL